MPSDRKLRTVQAWRTEITRTCGIVDEPMLEDALVSFAEQILDAYYKLQPKEHRDYTRVQWLRRDLGLDR